MRIGPDWLEKRQHLTLAGQETILQGGVSQWGNLKAPPNDELGCDFSEKRKFSWKAFCLGKTKKKKDGKETGGVIAERIERGTV